MITWNDLAIEFDKVTEAFVRAIKAFESLTRTYNELIEYCKKIQEGK